MSEIMLLQDPINTSGFNELTKDKWLKKIVKAVLHSDIILDKYGRHQLDGVIFTEYGAKNGIQMSIIDSKGKSHNRIVKIIDSTLDCNRLSECFYILSDLLESGKQEMGASSWEEYEELKMLADSVNLSVDELQRSREDPSKFLVAKPLSKDEVKAVGEALRESKCKQMADELKEQIRKACEGS